MKTALAVFDLDGTLIDSRQDLADSANALLASYDAAPLADDAIVSMVGCGAATLVNRVISAAGVAVPIDQALSRFLALYDARLTHHTRPYDGIPQLLERLHAAPMAMAVLTNKPQQQSVRILEDFGLLNCFQWIVGGDGPWPRQPSPEGMRFLMHEASADPLDTVLIGDSAVDLETSRNAGVRICLVRYGFGYADVPPAALQGGEALVDSPAEIADILHADR